MVGCGRRVAWPAALRLGAGAFAVLVSACAFGDDPLPEPGPEPDFESQVRPILTEHCTSCHSEHAQESLRWTPFLDDPDQVRGQDDSGVDADDTGRVGCRVVRRAVEELSMPPGALRRLTPSERVILRDFVSFYADPPGGCDEPIEGDDEAEDDGGGRGRGRGGDDPDND